MTTFGLPGDVPVRGDYDGDGKADLAVWRPSKGTWYVLTDHFFSVQWGLAGDMPVQADYDRDGVTDFAVKRGNQLFVYGRTVINFRDSENALMVPGDYDGDQKTDFGVFNHDTWLILSDAFLAVSFGREGDVPIPSAYF